MDEFIGVVKLFAGNFVPEGFLPCDGSLQQIEKNTVLFTILGTTYGGDGMKTFALPKLDAPEGFRYILCDKGYFPPRSS